MITIDIMWIGDNADSAMYILSAKLGSFRNPNETHLGGVGRGEIREVQVYK